MTGKAAKDGDLCPRCGAARPCDPGGDCWCKAELYTLPVPAPSAEARCFCAACLRELAEERLPPP